MPLVTPVLATPRLRLRPVALYDARDIQRQFARFDVVRYMGRAEVPWPFPVDGATRLLQNRILPEMKAGLRHSWAITLRGMVDDALIGMVDLTPHNPVENRQFWLGENWQGHGYMGEAVFAVNDFAFFTLKLAELVMVSAEANTASVRLKERSGAVRFHSGEYEFLEGMLPASRWRLTRKAWTECRESVWQHLAARVQGAKIPDKKQDVGS